MPNTNTLAQISVNDVQWSGRAAAAIKNGGFQTLAELDKAEEAELLKVNRLGRGSLGEIKMKVAQEKARIREDKLKANASHRAADTDTQRPVPAEPETQIDDDVNDEVVRFAVEHRNTINALISGEMVLTPRS